MRRFICFSLQLTLVFLACAQEQVPDFEIDKKFSAEKLRADLQTLKDSLEIRHPSLFRYQSKKKFESGFQDAFHQIKDSMSLSAFYKIATPLISSVSDLHTTLELPDEYYGYVASKSLLFPFDIRIVGDEVFVISNNSSDSSVQAGSRILKVNGEPVKKIVSEMGSFFSAEGDNISFKKRRIEQRFTFQYFIVYGEQRYFNVEFSSPATGSFSRKINALPFSEIRQNRTKNQDQYPGIKSLFAQQPFLQFFLDGENKTAVLTIKWFQNDVLESSGEDFKTFIDSAFGELHKQNIDQLVIDIRNNGGGESENAAYLYSWLTDRPFRFLYAMDTNAANFRIDSTAGVKFEWLAKSKQFRTIDSTTGTQKFFGLNPQRPHSNNFRGKLYVLIDGLTVSAAPQFAALVKLNKRGILIGESAPGALHGGSGRGYSYFQLPNSALLVMISQYRLHMEDPRKNLRDESVTPDYKSQQYIGDIIGGIDKDLKLAKVLMRNTKM